MIFRGNRLKSWTRKSNYARIVLNDYFFSTFIKIEDVNLEKLDMVVTMCDFSYKLPNLTSEHL